MTSNEKTVVMKDLDVNKNLKAIEESVVLTCHRIIQVLQTSSISEDEALDKIDEIKGSSDSQQTKTAIKIVSSLLHVLLNFSSKQCESNLIIETLRPFLKNCILSQCKDTNHEWMTYRMKAYNNDGKIMIPDLALYANPLSTINFELFIVEVKKQGNYSNGSLEKDLIKLGKEMKLALDKLLHYKV